MHDGVNPIASGFRDLNQFLYQPPSWGTKIELIKHLVLGGHNVLISVLGNAGGGKSAFSKLLHSNLEKKIKSVYLSATPSSERADFIRSLHMALSLEGECSLENCIRHIQTHQLHTLFIVDDAQYLSQDLIQEVVHLLQQQGVQSYIHICLISDFTMAPLLKRLAQGKCQEMIHTIELGSLTPEETTSYVYQRFLAQSGRFDDERLKQFYERTHGNLVEINAQLDDFFNPEKRTEKNYAQHKRPVQRYVMMGAAMLAAVGLGFILKPQTHQQDSVVELVVEDVAESMPLEKPMLMSQLPAYYEGAMRRKLSPAFIQRADLDDLQNSENDPPASSFVVMDKVLVIPKIIQTSAEKKQSASDGQDSKHPAQVATHIPRDSRDLGVGLNAPDISVKRQEARASSEHQALPPQNPAAKKSLKSHALQPDVQQAHYTIQLVASHRLEALRYFIKTHHLEGQAKIFKTQKQGRNWYILTLGDLGFRENAKQKVNHLPAHLTKLSPWVRPLSGLELVG